ncbi:VTT domain-containing protein [Oenococcus kitaharae]|uniref:VTT domain-containing protein n=1 Tax=Oenococcus TaxID=46254 RepID=UPI0021E8BDA9|nr:VTT domain-containing protein [Oenococcus kitaharae]MCV3296046.1 VTT domain-containing protein [Oenococcus kitaharae]
MQSLIDFILHIDVHLANIVNSFGIWSYALMFFIVLIETGAVILPFLPGDSLLFAAGALSAAGNNILNVWALWAGFFAVSLIGDSLNYMIGHTIGQRFLATKIGSRFIKPQQVKDTEKFYEKHGALAIILARYMPIIRTLAPFVAATSDYSYLKFLKYSVLGTFSWATIAVWAGFFFGNIPFVHQHFTLIILAIVIVTLLPAVIAFLHTKISSKKAEI